MSATPPDYYAVLGLAADADGDAIRTAYRALAKQHHPDLAEGDEAESTEKFLEIQEAYDVLGDPDRRSFYDLDLRRHAALEEARRLHRELAARKATMAPHPAARPVPRPAPVRPPVQPVAPFKSRRKGPRTSVKFYVGAVVLVVAVLGFILYQERQKNIAAKRDQITVVRVDGGYLGGPPSPNADALVKEREQFARLQASQAEAAKVRADAEKKAIAAAAAPPALPAPPAAKVEQTAPEGGRIVDCSGEGRKFSVFIRSKVMTVAYNGGAPINPVISDQGNGLFIMSAVEPTNRISLGFMKGDKDRTILLVLDGVGNVFRTIGMECSAAVF